MLFIGMAGYAQSELLARNYFDQGEYEKALSLYEKLVRQNPGRLDYFLFLIETHQQLEQFSEAEQLLLNKINSNRIFPELFVDLGYNYSLQELPEKAEVYYQQALEFIETKPNYAYNVGKAFENYGLLDLAVATYERSMQLNPSRNFNVQLARIYGEQGKLEQMFEKYIALLEFNPSYKAMAERNFSYYVTEDPLNEANEILRKTLLKRLQKDPKIQYNELLSWLFIQQKEFKKAFTQEKAIYRRGGEDLRGITQLALIAIAEEDYENAEEIVRFVIDNAYTPEGKLQGHQYLMKIRLKSAQPDAYADVEQEFLELFETYGYEASTHLLQIDYNHFLAFRNGKKEEAIANLKALAKKKLSVYEEARVKMELADILVYDEKFNQALIYYSQIQNKVKNDILAQEARFKVAKTSYYKGDFSWAQTQLDVLKKSASQLIANDAMQLSLMIRDNSLEDTAQVAMKKFARADLLALQDKPSEAIDILEDVLTNHKGESIEDEALLKQGELYESIGRFELAEANYLKLIEFYNEDILADDAHFRLAKLYEEQLAQPDKAKELYEQIIFNFADSIFFVEARKKYRALRGDAIN